MNDLLARLDSKPAPQARPRRASGDRSWRAVFVATSSARLARDWGELLARLGQEGFEVVAVAGDDGGVARLQARGARVVRMPALEGAGPAAWLGAAAILQGELLEHPAVMAHMMGGGPLVWLGALAAKRAGVEATFVTVEDHRWLTRQPCASPRAALPERALGALAEAARVRAAGPLERAWAWLGEQVDAYVTVTRQDMELVTRRELIAPGRVEVLIGGQGFERERFDPEAAPDRAQARAQLEVPGRWRRLLGVAGRLEGGARELPQIVDRLARRVPDVGWLIARPASGVPRGLERALQARAERVMLVEPGLEMRRLYAALDALVVPRYREGIPTVALEAQAMGRPCVGYATHGASAVISHGQTGWLLEPGDPGELAEELARVLGDPRQLEAWADRARPFVTQRFGRQSAQDQLLRLYDRVLERKLNP